MMDAHSRGTKSKKAEHRSWPGVITALFDEKGVDCSWAELFVGTLLMCSQKKFLFVCVQSAKNLREMVGNNEIKIFAITTARYPLPKMFKSTL